MSLIPVWVPLVSANAYFMTFNSTLVHLSGTINTVHVTATRTRCRFSIGGPHTHQYSNTLDLFERTKDYPYMFNNRKAHGSAQTSVTIEIMWAINTVFFKIRFIVGTFFQCVCVWVGLLKNTFISFFFFFCSHQSLVLYISTILWHLCAKEVH